MQYFKNKLLPQGILFLQETLFTGSNEASWRGEFNATLILSLHSCGVSIGFLGQYDVNFLNQMSDSSGRILILNVTIDAKHFVVINLITLILKTSKLKFKQTFNYDENY